MHRNICILSVAVATAALVCVPGTFAQNSGPLGQTFNIGVGEVNISGASMMYPLAGVPAGTNDFIDVDGDGCFGSCFDQLSPTYAPPFGTGETYTCDLLLNYRSIGSVNGLNEFIDFQLLGTVPSSPPAEGGKMNRFDYYEGQTDSFGNPVYPWSGPYANESGIPREQTSVDIAIMDVPATWALQNAFAGSEAWSNNPTMPGYGVCTVLSSTDATSELASLERAGTMDTLNTNTANPDGDTVFDTSFTWAPVAIISNHGTGIETIRMTDLQHLWVTGRLPSGENLAAATRDVGSGTRNACMNTSGIDPAWGRGENLAQMSASSADFHISPKHRSANCGGSSRLEDAVTSRQLAIGYTGLSGSSRAAKDAYDGKYEILNVIFDDRGGTLPVRPSIDTVLDNTDPNYGWQIGGNASMSTRGNPFQDDSNAPDFMAREGDPTKKNAAALFIENIVESVANFVSVPDDVENYGMPGEYLALAYFSMDSLDAVPDDLNPDSFVANAVNQTLQDFVRANQGLGWGGDTPPYSFANPAGRCPNRLVFGDGSVIYSDGQGQTSGAYLYWTGVAWSTVGSGSKLAERNGLSGDLNGDGIRDIDDAEALVEAYLDPRGWAQTQPIPAGDMGSQSANAVIPEVIGDFNGNGSLTKEDLRYFADGLAMDNGVLNRKAGAQRIDAAMVAAGADLPWADTREAIYIPPAAGSNASPKFDTPTPISTLLATGAAYTNGDFRGDVAGMDDPNAGPFGRQPVAGAQPLGWDGKVDAMDIDYVEAMVKAGDYSDIDNAIFSDLSADMDGDKLVTTADLTELVVVILKTQMGDVDLDGDVDIDDESVVEANDGMTDAGWADGDVNFDDVVDGGDLAIVQGNMAQLTVVSAVSRAVHGGVAMDNALSLDGAPIIEPRLDTRVILTMSEPVASASCTEVVVTNATCDGVSIDGNDIIVDLTASNAVVTVDVSAIGVSGDSDVQVAMHAGNTNGDDNVNVLDMQAIKLDLFQPVDGSNFLMDVNTDNSINILDMQAVKLNLFQPMTP